MTTPPAQPARSFFDTFKLYLDRRLLRIYGLGLASGFPWAMIGSAMTAWLAEEGLSRSSIGFFGFIFVAYSINFLWSPLVDRVRLPVLGKLLGQRRSWIILMQCLVALCCWMIASVQPSESLSVAKTLAFALALAAATLDISIDAFRIDSLPEDDGGLMAAGSAMATSGWWTGFAGMGALPLLLVDLDGWGWSGVYQFMAILMLLLALVPLFSPEPKTLRETSQATSEQRYLSYFNQAGTGDGMLMTMAVMLLIALSVWMIIGFPGLADSALELAYGLGAVMIAVLLVWLLRCLWQINHTVSLHPMDSVASGSHGLAAPMKNRVMTWVLVSFVEPLAEFFRRNGVSLALSILMFIFLFKIGEAFLGRMSIVFYKEVGFTNSDIAVYSKLVSWWVTIIFSLIGSVVTIHYGVLRGLFIGGLAMAASNLMFALLAFVGPSKGLLLSAVIVDGFTTAWSTVAFVAFLSMMCDRAFTASQYALMASIGTLGRTFLASYSGWMVDELAGNWALFFVVTALMVLPSLLLLYRIRHRLRALSEEF